MSSRQNGPTIRTFGRGRAGRVLLWACFFCISTGTVFAQGLDPLEESNRIFGQDRKTAGPRSRAARGNIAVVDYRLCFLLHPLMAKMRYSAMTHVLPTFDGAADTAVTMPSADERQAWRRDRAKFLEEQARLQQWIRNLGLRLDQEVKAGRSSKQAEERFYEKKHELEGKLAEIHARLVELDRKEKTLLEQATALREKTVETIRAEVGKVIRFLAQRRNFDVVFNTVSLPLVAKAERKGMLGRVETAWGGGFAQESNPYDLFFGNRMPREGGKGPDGRALLEQWLDDAPGVVGRLSPIEEPTVLYGGHDMTWDVLDLLMRKYKVARAKIDVLRKFVFDVRAR